MARKKYQNYISGNELLTIPSALEAISKMTISLLASDVNTRKLMGVSREGMGEVLMGLNIVVKVLARRTNAMWDIFLTSKEDL